ncbi:hypothetical protein DNK01_05320 [Stutzerimonas kirkiae]|nr:hypothetical protein DNK01_05320 [Stutzerimonas kirkiae]
MCSASHTRILLCDGPHRLDSPPLLPMPVARRFGGKSIPMACTRHERRPRLPLEGSPGSLLPALPATAVPGYRRPDRLAPATGLPRQGIAEDHPRCRRWPALRRQAGQSKAAGWCAALAADPHRGAGRAGAGFRRAHVPLLQRYPRALPATGDQPGGADRQRSGLSPRTLLQPSRRQRRHLQLSHLQTAGFAGRHGQPAAQRQPLRPAGGGAAHRQAGPRWPPAGRQPDRLLPPGPPPGAGPAVDRAPGDLPRMDGGLASRGGRLLRRAHNPATGGSDHALCQLVRAQGTGQGLRARSHTRDRARPRGALSKHLTRRFGELSPTTQARIQAADVAELERWTDNVLDARTLDEVFAAS